MNAVVKPQPIGRILIKEGRGAFLKVFKAEQVNGQGDPKFGASIILPPDHPQLDEIRQKMDAVGAAKWGQKWPGIKKLLEKQDRMALHDGDLKANYDGFPGNFYLSANSPESAPPTVLDRDRTPLTERSGRAYSGAYFNFSVEFWAQDNKFGQRINTTLRGLQFVKDGDSFSASRPADSDEFEALEEGAAADDFA